MKTTATVTMLFMACFSGLVVSADQDRVVERIQALPICRVLANASKYDEKLITVTGLYRAVIHGSVLYGPDCSETYVNLREASDYKADKRALKVMRAALKKDWSQPVDVDVRGTFRVAKMYHCFGQNCLLYEIEETELLSAKIPKQSTEKSNTAK